MATAPTPTDPRVTKHRVTMRSASLNAQGEMAEHKAVDYVRPDFLDAYVTQAQTVWQFIDVSEEPDAGPGGYEGATFIPPNLDHPHAGEFYPAIDPTDAPTEV